VALGEGENSLLFTAAAWDQLRENILAAVREYHRRFPLRSGIPKAEISSKVKLGPHFPEMLQRLFREGFLAEEAAMVRLPAHHIILTPDQQARVEAYLRQLSRDPYSPAPDMVLEADLMNLLVERGQIVKTAAGVVFSAAAYDEMVARILAHIRENGRVTLAQVRDMLQTSRRYAQALLEHMDEKKLTRRMGDERVAGEKS